MERKRGVSRGFGERMSLDAHLLNWTHFDGVRNQTPPWEYGPDIEITRRWGDEEGRVPEPSVPIAEREELARKGLHPVGRP